MKGFTLERLLFTVASLVVSFLLFVHVSIQNSSQKQREYNIPLKLLNVPRGLVAIDPDSKRITVVGTGPQSSLDSFDSSQLEASADLGRGREGSIYYRLDLKSPQNTPISFALKNPKVRVELQPLKRETRTVEVVSTGTVPSTLSYVGATIRPNRVEIQGPKDQIDSVLKLVVTVDLSKVDVGKSMVLAVRAAGKSGAAVPDVQIDPKEVEVTPNVANAPPRKSFLVQLDYVGQPAFGFEVVDYDVQPNQVVVSGRAEELARVKVLKVKPINIEGIAQDTMYETRLEMPRGFSLLGSDTVRVQVRVKKKPTPPDTSTPTEPDR